MPSRRSHPTSGETVKNSSNTPNLVKIHTDDSGMIKVVTHDNKVLPVQALTLDMSSREVYATVTLEMPVEIKVVANATEITMICPVCSNHEVHRCYGDLK